MADERDNELALIRDALRDLPERLGNVLLRGEAGQFPTAGHHGARADGRWVATENLGIALGRFFPPVGQLAEGMRGARFLGEAASDFGKAWFGSKKARPAKPGRVAGKLPGATGPAAGALSGPLQVILTSPLPLPVTIVGPATTWREGMSPPPAQGPPGGIAPDEQEAGEGSDRGQVLPQARLPGAEVGAAGWGAADDGGEGRNVMRGLAAATRENTAVAREMRDRISELGGDETEAAETAPAEERKAWKALEESEGAKPERARTGARFRSIGKDGVRPHQPGVVGQAIEAGKNILKKVFG